MDRTRTLDGPSSRWHLLLVSSAHLEFCCSSFLGTTYPQAHPTSSSSSVYVCLLIPETQLSIQNLCWHRNFSYTQYKHHARLPTYVQKALDNGYTITYQDIHSWKLILPPGLRAKRCILFPTLEATFAWTFWAMHTAKRASAVFDCSYLCLWPRDALEYLGLCSHSASEEPPVASSKEEFTQEEIEAQELGMAALKAS